MKLSRSVCLAASLIAVSVALTVHAPNLIAATTVRFSTHVNEQDFRYQVWQLYKKLVEDGTQGRVKIELFASSTLHPFAKAIDALTGGIADIATLAAVAVDDRLPCSAVTHYMPAYVNGPKIYDLHRSYNQLMKDEFDKLGLEVLFSFDFGYDQEWFFRKPPKGLDQLDGLLVRAIGGFTNHEIEAFGGRPVFIAPAETYQSAERGVVDGLTMGTATVTSMKLWEVMPYYIRSNMHYANIMYPITKKKLAEISAADQKVLRDSAVAMIKWAQPRYENWIQQQIGEAVMKYNVSVQNLSKTDSRRLVAKARAGWIPKVQAACGPEKTRKLLELFRAYGD